MPASLSQDVQDIEGALLLELQLFRESRIRLDARRDVVVLIERFCLGVEGAAKAQESDQRRINHSEH
jgi:hypothetical protein